MLDRAAKAHPDRTAFVDAPSGASVTYAELTRRVDRLAAWLHADGFRSGDRLATWAGNLPPLGAVTLAALRLGGAVTGLSPTLTEPEAAGQIADAGVTTVVTIPNLVQTALGMGVRRVIVLGDTQGETRAVPLAAVLATDAEAPTVDVDPDSVALLPYSSGTTGMPKGVMLSHRQVVTVCGQIAEAIAADERDTTLAVAPWFHIMGATAELLVPLSVGATVVAVPRFDPGALVDLLETHAVTYLIVPPPVAGFLATAPEITVRLRALRLIGVGGAPLPVAVHEALQRRLPSCAIGQGWGLTETSGALCVPRRPGGTRPGTVGRPLARTEVRAVDPENGGVLARGEEGELQARGPQMMAGYLGRPDETAALWTPDGWLHTGDLGYIEPDGSIVVSGRLKELIKVNALQVAPAEVEAVLLGHPAVADVAVAGRPDERTGETPVAYIVRADGELVGTSELEAWVSSRLAAYKQPTRYEFVGSIPRTPSGKILRRFLPSGAAE
jgi:acyl-CoA synthetase (AMP-forming)/AMP-acid ligase II